MIRGKVKRARPDSNGRPADSKTQVPSGERVLLRPFIWDKSRHDATRRDHALGAKMDTVSRESTSRVNTQKNFGHVFGHTMSQGLDEIRSM